MLESVLFEDNVKVTCCLLYSKLNNFALIIPRFLESFNA
jgi:hypothetical protein